MAEISAVLNTIKFFGDNNFIIGVFETNKGKFGGLGNILNPKEGMTYKLTGEWGFHKSFGRQFKFNRYYIDKPKDTHGLYQYLVKNVPGIGPATANEIIYKLDVDGLEVLKKDPERVSATIKGITVQKAQKISEYLNKEFEDQELIIELMGILDIPGLRKSLPHDMIKIYGSAAADMLRANPYIITQFQGTGFLAADRLAIQKLKIKPDSIERIKSAILYLLKQSENQIGSTWMPKSQLFDAFYKLICLNMSKFNNGLFSLEIDGLIEDDESGFVAQFQTMQNEKFIASKIKGLLQLWD